MEQTILTASQNYKEQDAWLEQNRIHCVLLVCDSSLPYLKVSKYYEEKQASQKLKIVRFSNFTPNPQYESVCEGVALFRKEACDGIIAVGGGSAIDVAKCIKLYQNMDGSGENGSFLSQLIRPNDIPFLAMPTTAGTGSEATRFAVIYYKGAKQSVTHESCIPKTVLMDPGVLKTLPMYQKKATMMDAFCHALESFWSVNSTEESRQYSKQALEEILACKDSYLANEDPGNEKMLHAAHIAGKAINISQTTAGHAMCYKITSLFGCAHGHAAILCDRVLFPWMIRHTNLCLDPRGEEYLIATLKKIAAALGCSSLEEASGKVQHMFEELDLEVPAATEKQYEELRTSVNPQRLKNHPIALNEETIDALYHKILR